MKIDNESKTITIDGSTLSENWYDSESVKINLIHLKRGFCRRDFVISFPKLSELKDGDVVKFKFPKESKPQIDSWIRVKNGVKSINGVIQFEKIWLCVGRGQWVPVDMEVEGE